MQCLHRWQKVLKPGLVKGPWTKEEDENVVKLVHKYGVKSWSLIARQLKGRLGKQCRERFGRTVVMSFVIVIYIQCRWYNHLNPDINKTPWTPEEDQKIIEVWLAVSLVFCSQSEPLCCHVGARPKGKPLGRNFQTTARSDRQCYQE